MTVRKGFTNMKALYESHDSYLYIKMTGEFSLAEANSLQAELIERVVASSKMLVLIDLSDLTGYSEWTISTMARFNIAKMAAETFPKAVKLAIVQTQNAGNDGSFEENVMFNRGVKIKVLKTLNEAITWLTK
jgi:anti-anti-sigma regulatory factor